MNWDMRFAIRKFIVGQIGIFDLIRYSMGITARDIYLKTGIHPRITYFIGKYLI